jgi:hypothetical protein
MLALFAIKVDMVFPPYAFIVLLNRFTNQRLRIKIGARLVIARRDGRCQQELHLSLSYLVKSRFSFDFLFKSRFRFFLFAFGGKSAASRAGGRAGRRGAGRAEKPGRRGVMYG